ncbi:cell division protein SepF [Cetobacterium sp. 8H]|uniref:cell division protein SepF n=1 Tax=Cetobacterium sp. 8H TaxID=2759681 RepID=UPI00163C7F0A|nr:cell division protein SepF [Cetobacterium sp. 8H]MBC2851459.1 cell division protein SepF [Cetobacterium sp. 8H]
MADYDIVFLKPTRFEDCLKCVEYIKIDKIVHLNLSDLDSEKSQRILDFISGAVHIQEGQIINPGEKIYCSIPKNKSYQLDYKERSNNSTSHRFDEEEEIIPRYNKK